MRITTARKAAGLLEIVIGSGLLLLLVGVQLFLFQSGASSWHKADAQAELVQGLQVALARMARELQDSTVESLTIAPAGLAALSPRRDGSGYELNAAAQLRWKRYVVFFHDPATGELRTASRDVDPPDDSPQPIEKHNFGSGLKPVTFYFMGGQRVAGFVTGFSGTRQGRCLHAELQATRKRYGHPKPEHVVLKQDIFFRN